MARRSRYHLPKPKTAFGLNITSMTDMFTILLVFLLQNYSSADIQINPEKDLSPPKSESQTNPILAVKVTLSATELKVEDKLVAQLRGSDFDPKDTESTDGYMVKPLFQELDRLMKSAMADLPKPPESPVTPAPTEKKSEESEGAALAHSSVHGIPSQSVKEGKILLMADRSFKYSVLKKVMYTASMAGYPQMKMITTTE